MFRLDGKTAIITGAGSGIGREIALLYAQQGAQVVVADVNTEAAKAVEAEIAAQGGKANAQLLNVADDGQAQAAVAATVQRYGRLDILVNNAGVSHVGNLLETSVEDWERVMAVNIRGVFLCSKHAVAQMLAQQPQGGVIVNIASVAGLVGIKQRFAYAASKGAVISMVKGLSTELARDGIYVNCVAPGWVSTDMSAPAVAKTASFQKSLSLIPLGGIGKPEEIAAPILFLCTEHAGFITGEIFNVNGGAVLVG